MIRAIGAIGSECDAEYQMIINELKKLGIRPTGNKRIDKARLVAEQTKKAEKILENKIQNSNNDNNIDEDKSKLEELKSGAMQLAQINRILHGI